MHFEIDLQLVLNYEGLTNHVDVKGERRDKVNSGDFILFFSY